MSDDDRLADYLKRMEDSGYVRTLADGCACGLSGLACRSGVYLASERCCPACSHSAG